MRRVRRPKYASKPVIKPFSIITLFSDDFSEQLLLPPEKVKFALNRKNIIENIQRLKLTASQINSPLLSGNQVGLHQTLMIQWKFDSAKDRQNFSWVEGYYEDPNKFKQIINPTILYAKEPKWEKQQCMSFPLIHFKAWRYNTIAIRYQNKDEQFIEEELQGVNAKVFQHSYDYFHGRNALDWRLHHGQIWIQKDAQRNLVKTADTIDQYAEEIKSTLQQYDNLKEIRQKVEGDSYFDSFGKQQMLSIQQDFIVRIVKHYRKQMLIYLEKLELQAEQKLSKKD